MQLPAIFALTMTILQRKIHGLVWAYAFFWTLVILIVSPLDFPSGASRKELLGNTVLSLLVFFTISVITYLATNVDTHKSGIKKGRDTRLLMLGGSLFCGLIWSIYYVLFFPGLISWDFYVQWHEMAGKIPFSDWHPVFHTLTMWVFTRMWYSPGMISLVQIITMAILVGIVCSQLARSGVATPVIWLMVLFYALFPLNGFYAVSLWKDIGYSISFLWLTLLIWGVVQTNGKALGEKKTAISLFIALVCVALMRHNGILPVYGSLAALFIGYIRDQRKSLVILTVCLTLFIVLFKGPVFKWLDVNVRDKNVLTAHLPIQHLGAILRAGGEPSGKEQVFLSKIMPLSYWEKAYSPYTCMPLIFGKDKTGDHYLNREVLKDDENLRHFLEIWFKQVVRHPHAIVQYYYRATDLLWRIKSPYGVFVIADEDLVEEDLLSGYKPSAKLSDRVSDFGKSLIKLINNPKHGWFLHRGALYFWLSLFFIGLTILRTRQPNILIVAAPMLLQSVAVALFPLVQDTRFMFPIILVAPLFIVQFFSGNLSEFYRESKK